VRISSCRATHLVSKDRGGHEAGSLKLIYNDGNSLSDGIVECREPILVHF
jgi:hypothetical protein